MIKLKDILGEQGGMKYSRGEWHNPQPRIPRPSQEVPADFNDIVDIANNDPRFETETTRISYKIIEPSTGNKWYIIYSDGRWTGQAIIDMESVVPYGSPSEEIVANFKEVTGIGSNNNNV
jgi:hypothetical protein